MFGRSVALPAARMRSRQRHLSASPESIAASLEPVVEQPVASSRVTPKHVERRRLAEHESADGSGPVGGEPEPRQAAQQGAETQARLEPGEMDAQADVRAVREGEVAACVAALKIELIGTGE